MADGDITSIKELGRFTIPGGGGTLTGVAKNNKIMVWGEIKGTYVSTGLDLATRGGPVALGLENLDYVKFEVSSVNATEPASVTGFEAQLARATNLIFMWDDIGGDAKPEDAEAVVLKYFAIGDSNAAPELT